VNINLTLIGQGIAFAIFVLFTMKFVWPPIVNAMREREKKIADGLAAADRASRDLNLAQEKAADELRAAKNQAAEIIEAANKRSNQIVEEAKTQARVEGERLLASAKAEIEQERNRAKETLRAEIATLAVVGAEKILETSIDQTAHSEFLNKLAAQL